MSKRQKVEGSFRDPSGFIFIDKGVFYRQINRIYADDYQRLMESGLYSTLIKAGLIIPHQEAERLPVEPGIAYKVIKPDPVPFISYPYEWTFGALKDAALCTLSIQRRALKKGMSLKDANAYNIQFYMGMPTLIDTLSFETYREGEPWVAYRQFCQHFLAPLSLMAFCDVRLNQLMRVYIDGIPLDLASKLLPLRSRWNFGIATHIHLHAIAQKRYSGSSVSNTRGSRSMDKNAFLGLIDSLEATVRKLNWTPSGTEWGDYYDKTNYTETAFAQKQRLVSNWLEKIRPSIVWDLGANMGVFSQLAAEAGAYTISFDIDPAAVEHHYRKLKSEKQKGIQPLILDLTNPSPAIGWHQRERQSLFERGPADLVMALAILHHLAISNNVPLPNLAELLADVGNWLILEFVPKNDSQVERLLRNRVDIFDTYTREMFELCFKEKFSIVESSQLDQSERWLYLMKKK